MKAPWDRPIVDAPAWPIDDGGPVVFLVDAHSRVERELLDGWMNRHRPAGVRTDALYIPTSRHGKQTKTDPDLEPRLAEGDDP